MVGIVQYRPIYNSPSRNFIQYFWITLQFELEGEAIRYLCWIFTKQDYNPVRARHWSFSKPTTASSQLSISLGHRVVTTRRPVARRVSEVRGPGAFIEKITQPLATASDKHPNKVARDSKQVLQQLIKVWGEPPTANGAPKIISIGYRAKTRASLFSAMERKHNFWVFESAYEE